MGIFLSKYIFENAEPDKVFENAEISELREIIQTGGPTELARHIDIKHRSWKEEPIRFGIVGKPKTGRSSFINAILNVKDDAKGFDLVETFDSLTTCTKYCHPNDKQFLFFKLPSFGSEYWKKCEYVSKTQLWEYDYFFIMFDTVLHEDDLWIAQQLVKLKKPFMLVRSKVDLDMENSCGENVNSALKKLRERTLKTINNIDVLKANIGVCYISSVNEDIGEMEKLKKHILNLKSKKFETILYSMPTLTKEIIQTKYNLLKRRSFFVAAAVVSLSAIRLSGIEVGVSIAILARELLHYINELALCRKKSDSSTKIKDSPMKNNNIEKTYGELIRCNLHQSPKLVALITVAVMQKKFEIFGPIIGVVITSVLKGSIAYNFIANILDTLTHELIISYDHVMSGHVPMNTSIRALLQLSNDVLQ